MSNEDTQLPEEGHILMDNPDERDVLMGDTIGMFESTAEEIIILPRLEQLPNQGLERKYRMSCTRQSIASIIRSQKKLAQEIITEILGFQMWDEALAKNPNIESSGDYLQEALKQAVEKKLIAGYYIVSSSSDVRIATLRGHAIFTGSNTGNWVSVRDKKQYALRTDGKVVGHAFGIIHSDENEGYVGVNSYGNTNGYFTIPERLMFTQSGNRSGNFFTMYAIVPTTQTENMMKVMNERNFLTPMQRVSYNAKLYNGLRNKEAISEQEAQTMCQRLLFAKSKTFTRKNLATILKATWSEKEPLREPTGKECVILLDRVILGEYTPTRGQVAELLGSLL